MDATGVLLLGGLSRRFGSVKALAPLGPETLAERALARPGRAFPHRIAVGKDADQLGLPFEVLDDGIDVRAPLAGVVAGLRAAQTEIAVFLPVDCPLVTPEALRELAEACSDAAVPPERSAAGRLCAVGAAGARGAARGRRARLARGAVANWTRGPSSWTATCSRTSTPSASSTAYGRLLRLRSGSASGWANA